MLAVRAPFLCILRPVKLLAFALLAEVARKRTDFQEAQEREEFPDPVLHGGPGQAPFIGGLQSKASTGNTCSTLLGMSARNEGAARNQQELYLDTMRFIEDKAVVADRMNNTLRSKN